MSHHKLAISVVLIMLLGVAALAQEAKVPVKVSPSQAYVFLDGVAIRDGNVTLKTTPGEHTIAVYNYGYLGQVRKVSVQAGKNEPQMFTLEPAGAEVSSPAGYIQIEGPGRAAVLLNGTTPDYHVGHVDEFNNHIGWSQQLLVPPGTHQLTVTREGNTIWSGPIQVAAGERVIVHVPGGDQRTQSVKNPASGARPRFQVGTASANVSVAPVSGTLSATPSQINCNDTSHLAYASVDTLHSSMKDDSGTAPLPAVTGDMPVSPRHTTTYFYEASGPGGFVKQDATVNVNPVVQSSLETTPAEIHYLRVGNKVLTQESSDLKWTVTNADAISIDPIGKVAATGQEKVTPDPKETTGQISESRAYTLSASNVCGGSDTKTAQLQIKGMIEPYILSVFFPTGYPARNHPEAGLVASQQEQLKKMASAFLLYAEHTPDAKVVVRGHADPRGSNRYNMKLSERRIKAVKAYLIAGGIPENKIEIEAMGKTKTLDAATVKQLEAENPFKMEGSKKPNRRATQLVYNRRIDIELQPSGMETSRFFPHQATDANLLMQTSWPSLKKVVEAQGSTGVAGGTGGHE